MANTIISEAFLKPNDSNSVRTLQAEEHTLEPRMFENRVLKRPAEDGVLAA